MVALGQRSALWSYQLRSQRTGEANFRPIQPSRAEEYRTARKLDIRGSCTRIVSYRSALSGPRCYRRFRHPSVIHVSALYTPLCRHKPLIKRKVCSGEAGDNTPEKLKMRC